MHQKSVVFITIGVFLAKDPGFSQLSVTAAIDELIMSIDINNIPILNIHRVDYRCIVFRISKNEIMHILKKFGFD